MIVKKLPTKSELIVEVKRMGVPSFVKKYKKVDVYQGSEESLEYLFSVLDGYRYGLYY